MLTFTARHFEKPLIPSSTQPTRKPPKGTLKPLGKKRLAVARIFVPLANCRAEKTIAIDFQIRLQLARAKSSFQSPNRT